MKRESTDFVFIHCSATPETLDVGAKEIREWHTAKGWSDIGYHFVIRRSGGLEFGRRLDAVGAHVRGYNSKSVGICMIGGVDVANIPDANFTDAQWSTLTNLVDMLEIVYPEARVRGHNEVSTKACPSFDVQEWLT